MRLGGLGIIDPSKITDEEFQNSGKMTENLTATTKSQQRDIPDIWMTYLEYVNHTFELSTVLDKSKFLRT